MPFETPDLVVRRVDAALWELAEPIVYRGATDRWTVPAGFRTDFASVPRVVAWLVPRTGVYTLAAVLHDHLIVNEIPRGMSPVDVDGVFRRVLRELGTGPVLRVLMWVGVRWGAAGNRARRAGWWRTAPAVLGVSVLAFPVVAVPAAAVALGLAVYEVVERVASRGRTGATVRT